MLVGKEMVIRTVVVASFTTPSEFFSTPSNDEDDGDDYGLGGLQDPRCVSGSTLLPRRRRRPRKLDAWAANKREIASFWYLALTTPTPSSLPRSATLTRTWEFAKIESNLIISI